MSTTVRFDSGGTTCVGQFLAAAGNQDAAPIVVLGHGFGGTVDSGLIPFAERLSAAGFAAFAFDYRYFGASGGQPRQRISMQEQVADFRAACAAAAGQPGVDPQRVVAWGVSLAGGHVFEVAATMGVAAAIALTPLVSGPAAAVAALPHHRPSTLLRSTATGWRSTLAQRLGREPATIPLVGRPGELATLTAEGYYEAYTAMAGPTWRNEIDAQVGVQLGGYRPAAKHAEAISCPMLVQIADFDRGAPPQAAAKAAFAAHAEVRHYPCDHFDVFPGGQWFDHVADHQIAFLTRHLLGATATVTG
ncbi:alpha/beta hydrolase [Mycolicibacter longobardus]|uniref:alpha/beta hydrolase n=1 Tax=Mycolicibacter longobardus TaxID=1108812 RepID=UPI0021F35779|nr:alpha/beta hydrolase [Mycolicibacter longobardus]MCV7383060.1 alpha/beta hydrolase [Mycolicibacter longobardus]